MIKVHKIQLNPTIKQQELFIKSCGVARFTYNWALHKWTEDYKKGVRQSAYSLIKHINSIKRYEFPWMMEVSKTCCQYPIHNLEYAFKKMWKDKYGHPKFKKKGVKDSFISVENNAAFKQSNKKIWLPRIGWVKCHEDLRFEGKINYVAVKRVASKWFAFVNVDIYNDTTTISKEEGVVGVDLGIKTMMVTSNGTIYENPMALKRTLKTLKRAQRSLSRKKKGSSNRKKQQNKVANIYYRISNIRKDAVHKATTDLVNKFGTIVIEDLNVKGMVKNHNLAQALFDVSFGEIRRQITYKCKWKGVNLIVADRFYPSSKTCSCCGIKKETLKLSERLFRCDACGISIDRDMNAAINLKNLAVGALSIVSGEVKPCGADSNILSDQNRMAKNQEISNLSIKLKQLKQSK